MKVSIIIPTFNRLMFTRISTAFLIQTIGDRADVEIIVVDNGSQDGTPEFLRGLDRPFRAILNRENRGFATACNQGAELASGEKIVFLNNDTVPLPGWLEPIETLLDDPSVGIVGSKLLFPDDTIQHAGVAFADTFGPVHMYYRFPKDYPSSNVERDYQSVTGACLGIRRSLFFDLGGFDEGYRNSFEDVDLCLRARTLNYRVVYCPRSVLYHFESVSEGRHEADRSNFDRYLERWEKVVVADALEWYQKDGFSAIPRISAQTLAQALVQLTNERRRADSLLRCLNALTSSSEKGRATEAIGIPSAIGPDEYKLVTTVPRLATAGAELQLPALLLMNQSSHESEQTIIHYAWRTVPEGLTVWQGQAGQMSKPSQDGAIGSINLLVPSISGDYVLTCWLGSSELSQVVGQQFVTVVPRFDFECRAHLPCEFRAGHTSRILVSVKNCGAETWLPHGRFRLSYHWYDETGQCIVVWDGLRTPILERIAYGDVIVLEAIVQAPSTPGRYQLAWDVVHEGEAWLSAVGAECPKTLIEVQDDGIGNGSFNAPGESAALEARHQTEIGRRVRQVAELEETLGYLRNEGRRRQDLIAKLQHDLRQQEELTKKFQRDHEAMLSSLRTDLRRGGELITRLQQDLEDRDREITRLQQQVDAFERGKVLRALHAIGRVWQRVVRRILFRVTSLTSA